jgi:hypothetical protein
MPFDLKNARATYQYIVNSVQAPYWEDYERIYGWYVGEEHDFWTISQGPRRGLFYFG